MNSTAIAVLVAGVLVGGAVLFVGAGSTGNGVGGSDTSANNVSIVDGTQIIEVSVRGGYHPQRSTAKAGMPTVLRFVTNGTYDCSSSVRIPSMGLSKFLPPSGTTDIELGSPQAGVLRGTCGMGMYAFEIDFGS